ncbi:MAG: NADH:ubiquinone oxidoreductase, Na translocating, B subunit [Spirochaetae bacterium HGW-Spirochaetae-9]|nr:MAG: NADH:ubiquinone oxidoreductase, Na translocating, B subunit [Spirochaetae bacterium HGW-Spirochaetae-9]
MMRRVLYALVPIYLYSIWMYGYRALLSALVVFILGIGTEWVFERKKSGKVSEAVLVTCALYAMAFPPRTPLWMLGVGIVFAVAMGKSVYGGFGRNIFNPAVTGRAFVYISFAIALSASYTSLGNFGIGAVDALASATPLAAMRSGQSVGILNLLLGQRTGAMGEGMVLLVAAAAVYLVATKTASWRIIVSSIAAAAALNAALFYSGVARALPMESLLAGSFLFVTVFMATDPVSAPKRPLSHYLYGALIGATVVVIRTFSAFSEGTSFAILFGNTFATLIDMGVDGMKKPAAPAKGGAK